MLRNQVRIIAGKWRNRKLNFSDIKGLRPTLDRVRETLFNWLSPIVHDAFCLDLFAGSGALGFEALSRGASKTVFVDQHPKIIEQLKENVTLLGCKNTEVIHSTAENYLKNTDEAFDIIFLDPPFDKPIKPYITSLEKLNIVKPDGYIYVEVKNTSLDFLQCLPKNWKIKKQKRAGNVAYYLIKLVPAKEGK